MANNSIRCVLLGLLAAATLWGCAPRADMEQVQNNQFQLRGMVASDRQQLTQLDLRLARLEDHVQELSQGAGSGEKLDARLATLEQRIGKLETAVQALPTGAASAAPPGSFPPGLTPPSAAAPAAEAPPPPATWRADLDKELESSPSASGAKLYRQGLEAMKSGSYAAAVEKFGQLQKKYPKSPLNEPGEYFSASALYELGKYDQSILQFNDLVMRFPKSQFASAALLREAAAFVQIKDRIDARLTLQKLLADHAGTPEASAANAMMRDLERD